jgi:hypothetical protein
MGWGTFIAGQVIGNARRAGSRKRLSPTDIINPNYLLYLQTSEDKKLLRYSMFGGWFGYHRFKTNKNISGIFYALTFGVCGIGWIIDNFRIAAGRFKFEDGLTGREKNPSNFIAMRDIK